MGTAIVLAILGLLIGLAIRSMVHNVKNGKGLDGGCGGDCSHCSGCK